ncbi:hypothetical protein OG345_34105 [Streptomyces sp. NBC_01220]|uniref:hypothetical protein n=1 Tax=Streptomyces sp. NBC_01220 TaxID=2903781 RepID=UPI00352BDDC9|nr:hypothetical protein OG345_34105 [Streptomyces sp. NBC_01220]
MNEEGRGPSAESLLALIGEHRESIRAALDDEQHALLLTRLSALADAPPDKDMAVRRALQGVRLALRPLPFDHPVRASLDGVRLVAAPPGPATVSEALALIDLLTAAAPVPEPLDLAAADPLFREPALSTTEATARCGGAPPPELIRLPDPPRGDRYPQFQFPEGDGHPHEVVLKVNRLLLADIDPQGAASWWLGDNTWLGGAPASLLGRLSDHELVCAATALVEGE